MTSSWLRNTPIRRKLTVISALTSGISLFACALGVAFYEIRNYREILRDEVRTIAGITGANCVAALVFQDAGAAGKTLAALGTERRVTAAAVYSADGSTLAVYGQAQAKRNSGRDGGEFTDSSFRYYGPVYLEGQRIGTIFVETDLLNLKERLRNYAAMGSVFLIASLLLAAALSRRMQSVIAAPILELSALSRQISGEKNFAVRARKAGSDEIGDLYDSFNAMLGEIQERDEELRHHQDHLEEQIRLRTAELAAARDRAEEASRLKSEFLANMSHEIRTPMNAVIGMTELALGTSLDAEQQEYLTTVRWSAESLLSLLDDILDFSKIEAGKMVIDPVPVNLTELVDEAVRTLALKAHAKGIEMLCDFDATAPAMVIADPDTPAPDSA